MEKPLRLFNCGIGREARDVLDPVLASGALAAGPFVGELEKRLEDRFPGRHAVVVSDMTQALAMALRMAEIGPGDEVLTLALNCMSSNSALSLVGATPIWVDVDPASLTVDLADCARALSPRTRALIVYHVSGYPANLAAVEAFCDTHGLVFIEDANNAMGARSAGRAIGTGGRFSILSFYANRHVNAVEGAALLCAEINDAERGRRLRRFGVDAARFRDAEGEIAQDADVPEIGFPASMTNVNARLACYHLDSLDARLTASRTNANALYQALAGSHVIPTIWRKEDAPAFWTFFVRSTERDSLMRMLKAEGVQCSKLHQRNDRYTGFAVPPRELPGTTAFEREMLALPIGWWLNEPEIAFMIQLLHRWRPGER